eukprot:4846240-Pleurochrysis_carterae.AAC.1
MRRERERGEAEKKREGGTERARGLGSEKHRESEREKQRETARGREDKTRERGSVSRARALAQQLLFEDDLGVDRSRAARRDGAHKGARRRHAVASKTRRRRGQPSFALAAISSHSLRGARWPIWTRG